MQSGLKKEWAALMLIATFVMAGGAGAAPITPSISGCTGGFTIKANGEMECAGQAITPCAGNIVLDSKGVADCGVALPKPNCSLTPTSRSIAPGGSVTLTANCTPAADGYIWTGGSCTGHTTSTCIVMPAGNTTYTVKGINVSGTGTAASATVTVTVSPTPSTQPNCNLNQMPYGSKISLDADCDAARYVWVGVGTDHLQNKKSGLIDPPSVTTTYSVTGYDSAGVLINTSSLTITVSNSCTLTAMPPSIALGESATLTASCIPAATGYNWNGACPLENTTATCIVTPAAVGTPAYTVTGTGTNTATSPAKTVTVTGPICSLEASPSSILLGETSTLKASCTPAATGYNWNGACPPENTSDTCIVKPTEAGSPAYTVKGTAGNTATSLSKTVTVMLPYCTLAVSPAPIGLGDTATLKASCMPAATGYNWNGAVCKAGTDADTCIVTPAAIGKPTYKVTGTGSNTATSDPKIVTVVDPFCTLTAEPSTISLGSSSTLSASCSPAATGYNWNGACAGISTNTLSATAALVDTVTVASAAGMVVGDNITIAGHPGVLKLKEIAGNVLTFEQKTTVATATNAAVTVAKLDSCIVTPASAGTATYTVTGSGANTATSTRSIAVAATQCQISEVDWSPGLQLYPGGTRYHKIEKGVEMAFRNQQSIRTQNPIGTAYCGCMVHLSISHTPCDFSQELATRNCIGGGSEAVVGVQTSDQPPYPLACVIEKDRPYYISIRQIPGRESPNCSCYIIW